MADTKSSSKTPGAATSTTGSSSLGQRVMGFFRGPASVATRKTSSTTRFIVGSVTFILLAELLTYVIDFANLQFKLNLNQPIIGASASWLTWFFLINVLVILGLWLVLNRLGFFPRDMWAPRNGTSTARGSSSSSNGASSNGSKNAAAQIPGIGKARTRAERRIAADAAAAAAAAKAAASKKRSFLPARKASVAEVASESEEHDVAYDRAKAAQRTRMRRARR